MTRTQAIAGIVRLCQEQITEYEDRAQSALALTDSLRRPIESADWGLAFEIDDCIDDWCKEHQCPELASTISADMIILTA